MRLPLSLFLPVSGNLPRKLRDHFSSMLSWGQGIASCKEAALFLFFHGFTLFCALFCLPSSQALGTPFSPKAHVLSMRKQNNECVCHLEGRYVGLRTGNVQSVIMSMYCTMRHSQGSVFHVSKISWRKAGACNNIILPSSTINQYDCNVSRIYWGYCRRHAGKQRRLLVVTSHYPDCLGHDTGVFWDTLYIEYIWMFFHD